MQTSKHTHLFKGELWVMHIHKVLMSCSSSKACRVLATKPIQRLHNNRKETFMLFSNERQPRAEAAEHVQDTILRECRLMPSPCSVASCSSCVLGAIMPCRQLRSKCDAQQMHEM